MTVDAVIERFASALAQAHDDLARGVVKATEAQAVRSAARSHTTSDERAVLLVEARFPGLLRLCVAALLAEREQGTGTSNGSGEAA